MLSRNIRPRSRVASLSAISISNRWPFNSALGPVARAVQAARTAQTNAAPISGEIRLPMNAPKSAVGAIERFDQRGQRGKILRIHIVELDAEAAWIHPDEQSVAVERRLTVELQCEVMA